MLLPTSLLSAPVLAADATLSRIVTAHAEQLLASSASAPQSISAQVRQHLAAGMAHGLVSLRSIAAQLHLSERSLQRQLQEEGTRFADLMDEVRRNLAQRYIADPQLALGEVAYLLGFSEPSAFHRAFKRWTGTTPAQARRASR